VQRLWIWVLLVVALSVPGAAVVTALPKNLGNHPGPRRLPYAVLGLPALPAVWFSLGKLVTEVRETELSIHFHLLWPERVISWNEIRSAEAVTYFSGGWGVRWGERDGRFAARGRIGGRYWATDRRAGQTREEQIRL
jgi:hypothetical protein